jgi:hypothetical protein
MMLREQRMIMRIVTLRFKMMAGIYQLQRVRQCV